MVSNLSIRVGVILLVVGMWGMLTGGYAHDVLGFGVSPGLNVIHIVSGAFAIIAGLSGGRAATICCLVLSAVYGLLTVQGVFHGEAVVRALNLNTAGDLLHLVVAVACLWAGGTDPARS
jgi:hypothetical protein